MRSQRVSIRLVATFHHPTLIGLARPPCLALGAARFVIIQGMRHTYLWEFLHITPVGRSKHPCRAIHIRR
jgi:hypothetical protein